MLSNEAIHQQVETLLSQMTLEEKAAQMVQVPYTVVGREEALRWAKLGAGSFLHVLGDDAREVQQAALHSRLGIPVLFGIDAIHGHGLNDHATIFPSQLACACAWDKDIAREMGEVTAREVATDGLHWTFSPVLCLGRDTRWGRVDETFGEDPYLAGELGEAIVRGYQGDDLSDGEHILACAKHYIGYGEAVGARDACDTEMTYRRLRETFLPPFEKAFRAGCATVMTAYGSIDGTPFTAAADYAVKSFAEEMEGRDLRLEQTVRGRNFLWDGKTAVADIKNLSLTGYQVIKYTLDESKYDGGAKNINSIPLIRYAEVLLNYAEAKAELGEFDDAVWNATIRPLRERAGVKGDRPATADNYLKTYYGVDDCDLLEIRRERAIELLLEGRRYDDLMRWHLGEKLNKQWYGIYVPALDTPYDLNGDGTNDVCFTKGDAGNETGVSYIQVGGTSLYSLENDTNGRLLYTVGRNFEEKRYLRPIPQTALNINPDLGQNYYWK